MPTPRKFHGNSKGGGGFQFKKPSVGGVWIFPGTTQYKVAKHNIIIETQCSLHPQIRLPVHSLRGRP